jgi:23S rRNA (cytidine1920-2'-O)/16S rRNA (cytidine1409-2'-O)-methyltransferase
LKKQRLDEALWALGLADSITHAGALVLAGDVLVNGQRQSKAGFPVTPLKDALSVKPKACPYVSRGGMKLAHALAHFELNPQGLACLDVGASTGGFTHCLLQHGAASVVAVDVGYGQLDYTLRQHPQVHPLERTHAKQLSPAFLEAQGLPLPQAAVVDVSFTSLKSVLPFVVGCLQPVANPSPTPAPWLMALVKPQFECLAYLTPQQAKAFDGVVSPPALAEAIALSVLKDLEPLLGPCWQLQGYTASPLLGASGGNTEFLTCWRWAG